MPSWRDRGIHPEVDCLIKPDLGRASRNSYQVWTYGEHVSTQPTLAAAKSYVEEVYGKLTWTMIDGDKDLHHDPTWGATDEFNDAPHYWTVNRLPRLGSASALTRSASRWSS